MPLDPLTSAQLDLAGRLRGSDLLADVGIYDLRPRSAEEAAMIETAINNSLGAMVGPKGRSGLAVMLPIPAFDADRPDVPGVVGDIIITVQILEKIMVNEGPEGTGISCEACAWTVMRLGHHLMLRPSQLLYAARMRPLDVDGQQDWDADVAWEVEFRLRGGVDPLPCSDIPLIVEEDGIITITTATAGAQILVTTDGSWPWPGNPEASVYDTPFPAPASGTSVRAITTKPGLADSGAAEITLP